MPPAYYDRTLDQVLHGLGENLSHQCQRLRDTILVESFRQLPLVNSGEAHSLKEHAFVALWNGIPLVVNTPTEPTPKTYCTYQVHLRVDKILECDWLPLRLKSELFEFILLRCKWCNCTPNRSWLDESQLTPVGEMRHRSNCIDPNLSLHHVCPSSQESEEAVTFVQQYVDSNLWMQYSILFLQ